MRSGDRVYRVVTLPVGHCEIPGPQLFWMSHWDLWLPLTLQVVLIRGNGIVALVNSGPPENLEPLNRGWAATLGERAALTRRPGELLVDQLQRFGVGPDEVTHVIVTPLQLYTVAGLLQFPSAQILLAQRGWTHFHTSRGRLHDQRATSIPDHILVPLVTTEWHRVRLLREEEEIAPGLRTWWCGVRHRASMVVEVDTPSGVVAISDSCYWSENVERDHPIGMCESLAEAEVAYRRIRRCADVLLALYDPMNFERFPDGCVA
jgi:glyoxylase-like metal-dependent hydrolase (beta-lactamase superfamily II)